LPALVALPRLLFFNELSKILHPMKSVKLLFIAHLTPFIVGLAMPLLHAAPAPAPLLLSPPNHATNVALTTNLRWNWRDSLLLNGGFEQGLTNAWSLGGPNPNVWAVWPNSDIQSGTNVAEAFLNGFQEASGSLIQPVALPPDTTKATLTWYEALHYNNRFPLPSLEISIWSDSLTKLETLHVSHGIEGEWNYYKWRQRTNDLTAYAGQIVQLVVQASNPWEGPGFIPWVDGFSLLVERATLPAFDVHLGKSLPLGPTNLVARVNALDFDVTNLRANTLYYWQVGSVRDGVTNLSAAFSFTTEQLISPSLAVVSRSADIVTVGFDTRAELFYVIEGTDNLESVSWHEVFPSSQGTGNSTTVDLPISRLHSGYWRLRVSQ
jgi:hypothetical protein